MHQYLEELAERLIERVNAAPPISALAIIQMNHLTIVTEGARLARDAVRGAALTVPLTLDQREQESRCAVEFAMFQLRKESLNASVDNARYLARALLLPREHFALRMSDDEHARGSWATPEMIAARRADFGPALRLVDGHADRAAAIIAADPAINTAHAEAAEFLLLPVLEAGGAVMILASRKDYEGIVRALAIHGVDVERARAVHTITYGDVDAMLAEIMIDGRPDRDTLRRIMLPLMDQMGRAANGRGTTGYGGLVQALRLQGKFEAAMELNDYCQELASEHRAGIPRVMPAVAMSIRGPGAPQWWGPPPRDVRGQPQKVVPTPRTGRLRERNKRRP